ncbi:conserved hypothetical protein [Perkinsus marinus ATCC 50983]|uniref:Uncharacterized protein n=1 Tax=Perkinsus marinus (strain ATCC 50983 / TXsc) TaxID=423536 RepID=C5LZQ8_PERM5|nr:conserved hypothetical protein [Perkinsus marinus ATCC 50983]EEQ97726.1 conserved hypothetical protein [Perkinsus marinus ATCC 50983]|eukprot:XP_002765009.1 conserved hypothetical protein [Perkinsus marinus ATCC 50983]
MSLGWLTESSLIPKKAERVDLSKAYGGSAKHDINVLKAMIDDGESDATERKRKHESGRVRPLKKESRLARPHRSDNNDDGDRSEDAVRKKLEEKASLYEQLMRSAAEGGDDDAVGGGRLVNFGNKVKQMEIWQDEEAERSTSSSKEEDCEVKGMDGGVRQVFERTYNPEDRDAADAFHAEAEAAQARLKRDEEFPRAMGRREAMKQRLAAARKRRKVDEKDDDKNN